MLPVVTSRLSTKLGFVEITAYFLNACCFHIGVFPKLRGDTNIDYSLKIVRDMIVHCDSNRTHRFAGPSIAPTVRRLSK